MADDLGFDIDVDVSGFGALDNLVAALESAESSAGDMAQSLAKVVAEKKQMAADVAKLQTEAQVTRDLAKATSELARARANAAKNVQQVVATGGHVSTQAIKSFENLQEVNESVQALRAQREEIEALKAANEGMVSSQESVSDRIERTTGVSRELSPELKKIREEYEQLNEKIRQAQKGSSREQDAVLGIDARTLRVATEQMSKYKGELSQFSKDEREILDLRSKQRRDTNIAMEKEDEAFRARELAALKKSIQDRHSIETSTQGLAASRYALYDVSGTLRNISLMTTGLAAGALALGANWGQGMANVVRTSGVAENGVANLKNEMRDLILDIPEVVGELTSIASIAGQLGVADDAIVSFTENVAKFSTMTGVAADSAAERVGRVAQLTGTSADEYQNLTAAIVETGVNAVATESAILSVSTEIASVASAYRMTSQDVVALSSAFASLGVSPELARGAMQRVLANIDIAVGQGGARLEQFAKVSQTTAQDFATAWRTDPVAALNMFLTGTNAAVEGGKNITMVLQELGINSIRDAQAILKLSQNMEVLHDAQKDTANGWNEQTEFMKGYATMTDTLMAKFQGIRNGIQAIFSGLDNKATRAVLTAVDKVIDKFAELAGSPVGSFILTFGVAVAGIIGILSGLAAMAVSTTAALLAFLLLIRQGKIAADELNGSLFNTRGILGMIRAEMFSAGAATNGFTGSVVRATAAVRAFATARNLAFGLGIGAAITIGTLAIEKFINRSKEAENQAKSLADSVRGAIDADTQAGDFSQGRIEARTKALTDTQKETLEANRVANEFKQGLTGEAGALAESTKAIDSHTLALGENYKQKMLQKFLEPGTGDEDAIFRDLRGAFEELIQMGQTLDVSPIVDKLLGDPTDIRIAGDMIQDQLQNLYAKYVELGGGMKGIFDLSPEQLVQVETLEKQIKVYEQLDEIRSTTDAAHKEQLIQQAIQTGLVSEKTAELLGLTEELGDAAASSSQQMVDSMFDPIGGVIALGDAMYDLGLAIAENGTSFDVYSANGRANLLALQQTMNAVADEAGDDTQAFIQYVEGIAGGLVASGVNAVEVLRPILMEILSIQAAAMFPMQPPTGGFLGGLVDIGNNINTVAERQKYVNEQLDRFGKIGADSTNAVARGYQEGAAKADAAGAAAERARKKAANAAKDAQKEIRTLLDYANDLRKVMSRAFELRFGFKEAKDENLSAIHSIRDGIQAAKDRMADLVMESRKLRDELGTIAADQSKLEYQLGIAIKYGDTEREAIIRADMAKNTTRQAEITRELAQNEKDYAKEAKKAAFETKGNTQEAIDNRKAVRDLVQSNIDLISAYAQTGASKKEVREYAEKLEKQLDETLRSFGMSKTEADKYTRSLSDFAAVAKAVPRKITTDITVKDGPAKIAIKEYKENYAKNIKTKHDVQTNVGKPNLKPLRNALNSFKPPTVKVPITAEPKMNVQKLSNLATLMKIVIEGIANPFNTGKVNAAKTASNKIRLGQYKSGGFTGNIPEDEIAGVVHGREYVVDAKRTKLLGVPFLNALGTNTQQALPAMSGAGMSATFPSVIQVELSPTDRRLIAESGDLVLTLDGQVVTDTVNRRNANYGVRSFA